METEINPDFHRILIIILASYVLFLVFASSAVAFVLMIFNVLKPSAEARRFLYGVFAVSSVGMFVGVATDFLRFDPREIKREAVREASADQSRATDAGAQNARITVYAQISSEKDRGQFAALRKTLPLQKYNLPDVQVMGATIGSNQIRYCNPDNRDDADALKATLDKAGFNKFSVSKIGKCSPEKNKNILEVWLQGS